MTEIAPTEATLAHLARLSELPTAELRQELARAIEVTADHLAYLAAVWSELERRGEDLSALRSGMGAYLPMIASGHLDAEAVVRFAGRKQLLRAVAQLPLPDQRRLARGDKLPVVVEQDGELVEQSLPAEALKGPLIAAVLGDGRVRPAAEQRRALEAASGRPLKRAVLLHLSAEEHAALRRRATAAGASVNGYVRALLRRALADG